MRYRKISAELQEFLKAIPDFRRTDKGNIVHNLQDALLLLIVGRLARCVKRKDVQAFGMAHLTYLKRLGMFRKAGLPSESTLYRVEKGIDDKRMAELQSDFARKMNPKKDKALFKLIAVDGKCMRGTVQENGRCPDIVGAYSVNDGLTVATEMCEQKSNEITAGPKLIEAVCRQYGNTSNIVFTADAMQCQTNFLKAIMRHDAHFLVEVKSNQKALRWGLEDRLSVESPVDTCHVEPTLAHGRIESRTCKKYYADSLGIDTNKWGKSLTVITVETTTANKKSGEQSNELRIYLTDLDEDAKVLDSVAKKHWAVETMHWTLDTVMEQDRIKRKHPQAARNLDTIQRLCLNILSVWKSKRRKLADRSKGVTELLRTASLHMPFLIELLHLK